METTLMVANIVMIIAVVLYSEVVNPNIADGSTSTGSFILTIVILVAMFGSLIASIIYLRLWKVFWVALQTMWKGDGTDDVKTNDVELNEVNRKQIRNSWSSESP